MTTTKNTDDKSTNAAADDADDAPELHPRILNGLLAASSREMKEDLAAMILDTLSTEKVAEMLRDADRGEAGAMLAMLSPDRRRAVLREAGYSDMLEQAKDG